MCLDAFGRHFVYAHVIHWSSENRITVGRSLNISLHAVTFRPMAGDSIAS